MEFITGNLLVWGISGAGALVLMLLCGIGFYLLEKRDKSRPTTDAMLFVAMLVNSAAAAIMAALFIVGAVARLIH